jgi:hypothetical protein
MKFCATGTGEKRGDHHVSISHVTSRKKKKRSIFRFEDEANGTTSAGSLLACRASSSHARCHGSAFRTFCSLSFRLSFEQVAHQG